jgi:hypothetical protein
MLPAQKIVIWLMIGNCITMWWIAWRRESRTPGSQKDTPMGAIFLLMRYLPPGLKIWFALSSVAGLFAVWLMCYRLL